MGVTKVFFDIETSMLSQKWRYVTVVKKFKTFGCYFIQVTTQKERKKKMMIQEDIQEDESKLIIYNYFINELLSSSCIVKNPSSYKELIK